MSVLSVVVWITGELSPRPLFQFVHSHLERDHPDRLLLYRGLVPDRLRSLHQELENHVRQRTTAWTQEMAERERLEKEILQITERERRRIGRDLHDSLCQHLTATALAGQVLGEQLDAGSLPDAADAGKLVELVEDGIKLARNLARGIYAIEMEAEGLMGAFRELADNITKGSKVSCVFECDSPVLIHDDAAATHLYRIAPRRSAMRSVMPKPGASASTSRNATEW